MSERRFQLRGASEARNRLVLIGIALIVLAPLGRTRSSAIVMQNISNLKSLSLSVLQYCNDHDDRFPPNMDSADAVYPYLAKQSPGLRTKPPHNRGIYLSNWRLAEMKTTNLKDPARVIMFLDTNAGVDGNVQVVVFADSSTRISRLEKVSKAIANHYRMTP